MATANPPRDRPGRVWSWLALVVAIGLLGGGRLAASVPELVAIAVDPQPVLVDQVADLRVVTDPAAVSGLAFAWNFGDGATSTAAEPQHHWTAPGTYLVRCRVSDGTTTRSISRRVSVVLPATTTRPSASSTMSTAAGLTYVVNPDNETLTAIDPTRSDPLWERPTGADPQSVVAVGDELWVACRGDDSIRIHARSDGSQTARVNLDHGSAPTAIALIPGSDEVLVSCLGSGELLRGDTGLRAITDTLTVGPTPRAIAVTGDGSRALVTRFISGPDHGTIYQVDLASWTTLAEIPLVHDDSEDTGDGGRGLPNYLLGIAIAPDGTEAVVCAKKDNIRRGVFRDGLALAHDLTVRNLLCVIDLASSSELLARRLDVNKQGLIAGLTYAPHGDWVLLAQHDNNEVLIVERWRMERSGGTPCARGPRGLVVAGDAILVHAQLDRRLQRFDAADFFAGTGSILALADEWDLVADERLAPEVLFGKRIFHDASDLRMAGPDGYMSCASCHFEGGHDGRTWDFGDRGEGLRNTTTLLGKRGTGHGRLHWTANFDEIQDFDNDIRGHFGGSGFLDPTDDAEHLPSLGSPKAGLSPELDALSAYLASLDDVGRSPHRRPDGRMTDAALVGAELFRQLDCARCHGGADFTDSHAGRLHDVGTLTARSGSRLGQALTGLDTPTLIGLWATAPYLHDGSAPTLADLVAEAAPAHGGMAELTLDERAQLVAFLRQIESDTPNPGRPVATATRRISIQVSDQGGAITTRVRRDPGTVDPSAEQHVFDALDPTLAYRLGCLLARDPSAIDNG